ncbi:MAG: HD domain-containing protein [Bacteroidetes bacterium]|nr:HD domain-containing protein [Bacteroidota bacterium]MDA1224109.1 HD domain-containing protein [Bacteroidota bacterium]
MPSGNKSKLINDPLHGFVTLPSALVYDVVQHPYFQRLRRIRQLGMSEWVYPGATHTRFHHALGAMNLMVKALDTLRGKGVEITDEEKEAAILGILMHDIGHGPYSHTLEYTLAQGVNHEDISIMLMERMNIEFGGALRLAIDIFRGDYHKKPFLHQLISGELDMDRLDYLMRDSFYTGVSEGIVGVDRLIHMLNVKDGDLVVEEKGIYSVEKFLVARRLMYWQVYLHKTVIAADALLVSILQRAREMAKTGSTLGSYHPLMHFLFKDVNPDDFNEEDLDLFVLLDDIDIMSAIKEWQFHEDPILSEMSRRLLRRHLPKIKVQLDPIDFGVKQLMRSQAASIFGVSDERILDYFVHVGVLKNDAYGSEGGGIRILKKDGSVVDVAAASDNYNLDSLKDTVTKYYITYWEL